MALIKCPECGNQISDKAEVCPHCGVEVQKVLDEIREKQRIQRKKRRKSIIISSVSVCVVAIIAVLAYLYSIDALNTIPAEYRKQTEGYFKSYKINLDKGDFEKASGHLNTLKNRRLTHKQAKCLEEGERRFEERKKAMVETELSNIENTLASITNNYDNKIMENVKKELDVFDTCQLDASQTERLQKAKEKYVKLQLVELEKRVKLHESDTKDFYSFYTTEQLAKDLQEMELSTTQKIRLEELINNIGRIKNQKEEVRQKQLLKTIRDEYVRLIGECTNSYGAGYFLYDIDNNGIPELWIKSGGCEADYELLVYNYNNSYEDGIRLLYKDDAGHSSFYQGDNYIIKLYAHMGYANWTKLTYDGWNIVVSNIYDDFISDNEDYLSPEEPKIHLYSLSNKEPIIKAF